MRALFCATTQNIPVEKCVKNPTRRKDTTAVLMPPWGPAGTGALRLFVIWGAIQEGVMAIPTTVVGSWWPYPEDEADLARYHAGKLSAAEGDAVLKRAATRAIAEQKALGLTEWTGGEYHTHNFIMHMYACLNGHRDRQASGRRSVRL